MRRVAFLLALLTLVASCGGDGDGDADVFSLSVGTCFDDQDDGEITSVPEVDCSGRTTTRCLR